MSRKRITQVFPFLLPLRKWQRKKLFYLAMRFDKNKYAENRIEEKFPYEFYSIKSKLINENSGYDIKYQYNKAYNLRLVAKTMDGLVIEPGETFSFWNRARYADRDTPFKDGLSLVDGKIIGEYGGGICQISSMLYELFLHAPVEILERHPHGTEEIPPSDWNCVFGIDATINEGWQDLKVLNNTDTRLQITISFDDTYMYGMLLTDKKPEYKYEIFNDSVKYVKRGEHIYRNLSVSRRRIFDLTGKCEIEKLYESEYELGYKLPKEIEIIEGGL